MKDFIALIKWVNGICKSENVDCRECPFVYRDENNFKLCAWNTIPSDWDTTRLKSMLQSASHDRRYTK